MRHSRRPSIAGLTLVFAVVLFATAAQAQLVGTDTAPGESCAGSPAGATRMTADADQDGAQVVLICDGTSWIAMAGGSGTPAGADRQIQFNSGGIFMADSDFVFTAAGRLGVGNTSPQEMLHVGNGNENSGYSETLAMFSKSGGSAIEIRNAASGAYLNLLVTGGGSSETIFNTAKYYISPLNTKTHAFTNSGLVGINNTSPDVELDVTGIMRAIDDAAGCTATERGAIRFNSATGAMEFCDGAGWTALGGGGGALDDLSDAATSYGAENNLFLGSGAGASITAGQGTGNVFIGQGVGGATTDGDNNVAVGYDSFEANTSGIDNVVMGVGTLNANTTGNSNIAIGYSTMFDYRTGSNNTAVGDGALWSTAGSGSDNTAIGRHALWNNTTGGGGVAVGVEAMAANTTSSGQVAVGYQALMTAATATGNTAVGYQALKAAQDTALNNTAVGYGVLDAMTTGVQNTALGFDALGACIDCTSNTVIGFNAGKSVTSAGANVFIGDEAGEDTTTGGSNVFIGDNAGLQNVSGQHSTCVGRQACQNTAASNTTAFGRSAGRSNTSGGNNVYVGASAGINNTNGAQNTIIGNSAATTLNGGDLNIVIGYSVDVPAAATSNYLNIGNLIYGDLSAGNVGIGTADPGRNLSIKGDVDSYIHLTNADTGDTDNDGTLIGIGTTEDLVLLNREGTHIKFFTDNSEVVRFTSSGNVGIGTTNPANSLHVEGGGIRVGEGDKSFLIGYNPDLDFAFLSPWDWESSSGKNLVINGGGGNVGIGTNDPANSLHINGASAIVRIQSGDDLPRIVFSNSGTTDLSSLGQLNGGLVLSGAAVASSSPHLFINNAGDVGIGTTSPNQGKIEVKGGSVCVDTNSDDNASSCIASESDMRLKRNIADLGPSLDTLMALRPVSFEWRYDDPEVLKHYPLISRFEGRPQSIGLIAQDVQELVPEAIQEETVGDAEVQYLQLDYDKLVPVIIKAMQEQQAEIGALHHERKTLRTRLQTQQQQIDRLLKDVNALKAGAGANIREAGG